jgi:hypothetical protein
LKVVKRLKGEVIRVRRATLSCFTSTTDALGQIALASWLAFAGFGGGLSVGNVRNSVAKGISPVSKLSGRLFSEVVEVEGLPLGTLVRFLSWVREGHALSTVREKTLPHFHLWR